MRAQGKECLPGKRPGGVLELLTCLPACWTGSPAAQLAVAQGSEFAPCPMLHSLHSLHSLTLSFSQQRTQGSLGVLTHSTLS